MCGSTLTTHSWLFSHASWSTLAFVTWWSSGGGAASAAFSSAQWTMSSAVRPPLYSSAEEESFFPPGKNLIVGKPLTPYLEASPWWTVASTAPSLTLPLSSVAAFSQCGARFLQWPHQGAKNSTSQRSSLSSTSSSKLLSSSSTTSLFPLLPPLLVFLPRRWSTTFLSSWSPALATPSAVRAPLKSVGLFLLTPKILTVGKPRTPYCPAKDLSLSASTAPTFTTPFSAAAALMYSGAND
uniref:Putative secreted protein n=1 Tax=Ixodes ricinus TaxID=34613 RepID=A0A6B0V582_IXORI